jgi:hypothetical protein
MFAAAYLGPAAEFHKSLHLLGKIHKSFTHRSRRVKKSESVFGIDINIVFSSKTLLGKVISYFSQWLCAEMF